MARTAIQRATAYKETDEDQAGPTDTGPTPVEEAPFTMHPAAHRNFPQICEDPGCAQCDFVGPARHGGAPWKVEAVFGPRLSLHRLVVGQRQLRNGRPPMALIPPERRRGRSDATRSPFASHLSDSSAAAIIVLSFEVREDLRCGEERIGTTVIHQLIREYRNQVIYLGSAAGSHSFWQKLGWRMCACDFCDSRELMIRVI